MSPAKIIQAAKSKKLDILAITDHNSTLHCQVTHQLGNSAGIWVIPGVEINSAEEVHGLALFDSLESAGHFQHYLNDHLPFYQNNPSLFGHQVVVNEFEEILQEIEPLLITALDQSLDQIANKVYEMNGIFIPAHINRPANGMLNQLGFIPDSLLFHALEITGNQTLDHFKTENPNLSEYCFIRSSDAHYIHQLGTGTTDIWLEELNFEALKNAFVNHQSQIMAA
jgi:PHP family Zn ribbon phosphoesterase